ncbi:MAG TPA: site-specific integrase [Anaerolineales bacterium]|nr:site-specific integrase [Anaerolineales bacterium]
MPTDLPHHPLPGLPVTDLPASLAPLQAAVLLLNPTTSLAVAIDLWKTAQHKQGLSLNTIKNYGADVQLVAEYLGAGLPLAQITTQNLNEYLNWMRFKRGRACSDKTVDRRITALKSFFRWVTPNASLPLDPAEAVLNVSVRSPLPQILNAEQMQLAYAAAERLHNAQKKPDIRPLMLLRLVLESGLRKGEVARLERNHLDLTDVDEPHFYVRYKDKRHRHKERRIAASPELVELFQAYFLEYPNQDVIFPWSVRRLEYLLSDIATAAGFDFNLSFDMLRWTSAVLDYDRMDAQDLRRKLGLSKIQWTEIKRKLSQLAASAN